jgi:hypothetical protein
MAPDIKMIAMGCKPDPHNFDIVTISHCNGNTIVEAKYHGCITFNGHKLMLLAGIHTEFETLDPHFLDENYAVIGRFIPNKFGWSMARAASLEYAKQKCLTK